MKENHHLLVGTSVNTLKGERKGWMRSRALSAHVKTEELPLPASMSVPTHSVCLTRLTPIGRKKQWILEPGTENSGSFWSRLTDRQRYLSSNLSPAHLLPPSSMTQKQTRPAAHGPGAVVWEARGQCGAEVWGGSMDKESTEAVFQAGNTFTVKSCSSVCANSSASVE